MTTQKSRMKNIIFELPENHMALCMYVCMIFVFLYKNCQKIDATFHGYYIHNCNTLDVHGYKKRVTNIEKFHFTLQVCNERLFDGLVKYFHTIISNWITLLLLPLTRLTCVYAHFNLISFVFFRICSFSNTPH